MPEGHLLHRHAREQHAALAGRAVRAASPQGRFDAAPFDGHRLESVRAAGKNLLYAFDGAPAVHVHLGVRGLFLRYDAWPASPPRGTRFLLGADGAAFALIAPSTCEALDDAQRRALLASLGPDPLDPAASREEAVRRLVGARGPVGAALLEQSVWAGIGNAWRAELLFLAGVDPARRAGEDEAGRLWDLAVRHLQLGVEAGRVVSDPGAPDERWVYKREACRRCGAPVRVAPVGGRTSYACPVEQT
ncbi:DNA-formamidopyrimidine glycosylase family protein [Kineococcus indalonis]|uniref:DNA-formamidopyrimidine glycosylase family protein n=1 Tax=Kineococcus indalonis TaxID=2696566 RepID=UPI0014130C3B|nr:DNA-formamidopyrimidine glycosylase family protein [Kineococcus indalonis]NAZ86130.1 formamidopyrimidine-DNA glycolase [Kineococcus indalonis]